MARQLGKAERASSLKKSYAELNLYDCLLRANHHFPDWQGSQDDVLKARELYVRATELDPECAAAYAGLAETYEAEYLSRWSREKETAGERTFEYARNALALDGSNSKAHLVLARAYRDISLDIDLAQLHVGKAINANPNDYWSYCVKCNLLTITGDYDEGIQSAHEAIRRNPQLPDGCLMSIGMAEYFSEEYERAITTFGAMLQPQADIEAYRAACYAQLDRKDQALAAANSFRSQNMRTLVVEPANDANSWRGFWADYYRFRDLPVLDHLLDGLRKAEIVE